jgi:hypothetical protein
MQEKVHILTVALIILTLSSCGCLEGEHKSDEKTAPLANSLLVVRSAQVMPGYNASLSCVLNSLNGQGLDNQSVYWYLDGTFLGQSSTYFGFATYNLSVGDVSALSQRDHQIRVEYKGNADYAGTSGSGVLAVVPKPTPTPSPSVTPSPSPGTATAMPSPSLTPTVIPAPTQKVFLERVSYLEAGG